MSAERTENSYGLSGIVQVFDDVLEYAIINRQIEREGVGRLSPAFVLLEMKQTGVVPFIGAAEHFAKACVHTVAVLQCHQPSVLFYATVLADAQKYNAVYGALDGKVQVVLT